jgi:4-hydroxyphenylpyruvate 3-dimethylallyltransferase
MPPLVERIDPLSYDPLRFLEDLRRAARAIDAPFDEAKVRKTLDVFDAELRRCVVQMKATCQAGTGVYYRFFYKWERDLTALAQEHGLIPAGHSPLTDLQVQVLSSCRGATRAGLDLETGFGLAKVWTFTGGPAPIDQVMRLPAVPDSVRQHARFFERHRLRHVFFVASDFQQDSMNVYFGLDDDCRSEEWLRRLVDETGGGPEEPSVYAAMLASLAVSAGVGTTFRWDRPEMGRWCLYGLNVPADDPVASAALPPLPPRLVRFRDQAPTLNRSPQYNVAWSFGRAGFYTKLEKSYAKDADYFLTVEMGGDLTHAPAGVGT